MNNLSAHSRPVAIWVGIGVVMLLVQVVLGGVTRLTGSGLSITEWNIITGTLPPLNDSHWLAEFDKYKQTPQFQLINADFTLKDFKFIFFWEWLHRFWARLIGVVFIVGFVYLLTRKKLKKDMARSLVILFLLGALQGAVGWIMVASGLTGDAVYVKPTRLALHFIFALGLVAYAFWFFLKLTIPRHELVVSPQLRAYNWWLLALLTVQLVFGALMAGHKAATAAPTWPDINGALLPAALFRDRPFLLNFIENKITIHFVHRMLAYLIAIFTVLWTFKLFHLKAGSKMFDRIRTLPLILVSIQVVLGITAVVVSPQIVPNRWGAFEWLAQLHQVTGLLMVLSFVSILYTVRRTA